MPSKINMSVNFIKMAAFMVFLIQADQEARREKYELRIFHNNLRDASNPFELPDRHFTKLFRLNKPAVLYLLEVILPLLPEIKRSTAIPNYLKLLCALHFFGHGSYQLSIGKNSVFPMSQPAVSRIITSVSDVIYVHLLPQWIKFPQQIADMTENRNLFLEKFNFPDTIGAIDGTHIGIIAPPAEHPIYPAGPYYNRKGFYSINLQIIADANMKILNLNARFPGSVHDAAIWTTSNIHLYLREQYLQNNLVYHLLGDEGYPLVPWLLVPYPGNFEDDTPQSRFNRRLRCARMCIERTIGILKGRFRCLLKHRTLNYNPLKAGKIIYSCGVLHNIALQFNAPEPDDNQPDINNEDNIIEEINEQNNYNFLAQGVRKRNEICNFYFG